MIFNSIDFLFKFLPIVVMVVFVCLRGKAQVFRVWWLILCSLFFYAQWNYKYLALILGSALFNDLMGQHIHRTREKKYLVLAIAVNLTLLGYFKYFGFLSSNLALLGFPDQFVHYPILPLAISFFTFQQIAYLVDTYKSNVKDYKLSDYLLFVCFFPQLIAGPIVQHHQFIHQFKTKFKFDDKKFATGCGIFVFGICKKVLIADNLAVHASAAFNSVHAGKLIGVVDAWFGVLCYTFQIYFDFSGYSDMAIGLALLFGLNLPMNFNSPYKSLSISDFWRRWHMTLSAFLRNYLYIPLGGNRCSKFRRHFNLMMTMFLGGLWHGAGWNFIIWGGLHGSYLVCNHLFRGYVGNRFRSANWNILWWFLTFTSVVIAWVFFRSENFPDAVKYFKCMFGFEIGETIYRRYSTVGLKIMFCLGVALLMPNTQEFFGLLKERTNFMLARMKNLQWRPSLLTLGVFIFLIMMTLDRISKKTTEFLYYQF